MTQCKRGFGPWRHGRSLTCHRGICESIHVRCRRGAYRDNSCEQEDSEPKECLHIPRRTGDKQL